MRPLRYIISIFDFSLNFNCNIVVKIHCTEIILFLQRMFATMAAFKVTAVETLKKF